MGRYVLAGLVACMTLAACGTSPAVDSPSAIAAAPSASASATMAEPTPTPSRAAAAPCPKRSLAFDPTKVELTGAWLGNDDGVYYIRQIGNKVWWNGMSGQGGPADYLGRDWNNVAAGELNKDLTIDLDWADVPRGGILGYGTLKFKVEETGDGNTKLTKVSETGTGFGGETFSPCAPG